MFACYDDWCICLSVCSVRETDIRWCFVVIFSYKWSSELCDVCMCKQHYLCQWGLCSEHSGKSARRRRKISVLSVAVGKWHRIRLCSRNRVCLLVMFLALECFQDNRVNIFYNDLFLNTDLWLWQLYITPKYCLLLIVKCLILLLLMFLLKSPFSWSPRVWPHPQKGLPRNWVIDGVSSYIYFVWFALHFYV